MILVYLTKALEQTLESCMEPLHSLMLPKRNFRFATMMQKELVSAISRSDAGVILCKNSMKNLVSPKSGQQLIFTENPRLAFVRATNKIYHMTSITGISPHAVISDESKIGNCCYIGHFTVIGKDCTIGDNCIIGDSE